MRARTAAASVMAAMALLTSSLLSGAANSSAATASATDEEGDASPTNLALDGTATASSVELGQDRFRPENAIDGDPSTRWSSEYVDPGWLKVELAAPSTVHHVTIDWPNACARAFTVQVSTDGQSWTTVADRTSSTCPRSDYVPVGVDDVRFVKVVGTERWSRWGYSISELGIWDRAQPGAADDINLVPKPVELTRLPGAFQLTGHTRIVAAGNARPAGEYLAEKLRPSTDYALPVVAAGPGHSPVVIRVGEGLAPPGHAAEGYHLQVRPGAVRITAQTPRGALNGVQTLRQLLPQWAASTEEVDTDWLIPAVSVADYPRFAHRGIQVDSARSFVTVNELKEVVDHAAAFKFNRLHLHLTDDQGWRIAIDNPRENPSAIDYERLTEVSGRTAMTYGTDGELMGTELGHTGWYSQAEYREIIEYAGANGITVIPEVDMPGHTNAALHAIPQLNSGGSHPQPPAGEEVPPAKGTPQVGYSSFDVNNPVTYEFVTTVLTQIAEMTPGPYLHIGGDEAHVTPHADYLEMVDRFTRIATGLGKTVIGWNEYAASDLPQGKSVIQHWWGNRARTAERALATNSQVILSPAERAYVPQKQDSRQPNGGTWACGGPCSLSQWYSWDPARYLPGLPEEYILGVESPHWGEFIRGNAQMEFFQYPRLLATAEVGWTPQSRRDYADFTRRVAAVGGRMALAGINHFPTVDVYWNVDGAVDVTHDGTSWEYDVTVTSPATEPDEIDAEIRWADGTVTALDLTTSHTTDIPAMRINGTWTDTVVLDRRPRGRTATLVIERERRAPVMIDFDTDQR